MRLMALGKIEDRTLIHIGLSRTNLLGLLAKLEEPDSLRTLAKVGGNHVLVVSSEPDDEHYKKTTNRTPGLMSDTTTTRVREMERL